MSKKWKDTTKCGFRIVHGPFEGTDGFWAGVINDQSGLCGVTWGPDGFDIERWSNGDEFDLVPADPEVDYVYGQAMLITNARGLKEPVLVDGGQETLDTDNLKLGFVDGKLVSAEVIGD